jgi:hypothetical protein
MGLWTSFLVANRMLGLQHLTPYQPKSQNLHHRSSPPLSQPHFGQVWGEAQHFQSWGFEVL